jgi:diguanylate cyclase (GGDEF)-like protein/PAS domain S-box-containing protein
MPFQFQEQLMKFALFSAHSRPQPQAPDAVYIGFVDSFLVDRLGLALTIAATILGSVAVSLATASTIEWCLTGLMALVSLLRLFLMVNHAQNRPSASVAVARKREQIYVAGAILFMAVLGLWTISVFWETEDEFSRLIATLPTIACLLGIWTRSFAVAKGTNTQLLVAFIPLCVAFSVAGGHYPVLIIILLAPLFLWIKNSSRKLRDTFLGEVAARQEAATLATRLDTALNNMSHGLCMLDREGRLTVVNDQVLRIFGLRAEDIEIGADIRAVLRTLIRNEVVTRSEVERLSQALFRSVAPQEPDFVVPLETKDNRAIEITVHRMKDEGTVVVIQDVTERRNAERAIDRMARFDSVTDLPNRRCFEEQLTITLKACRQAQDKVAVLFLDLDDFKQVNDSLGHTRGDKLLAAIAERLQALVRPTDLVARWGGDEFAILQRPVTDEEQTGRLAEQIIREVSRPVFVDGYEVIVGVSVGSACAPQDGVTPDIILSNADMALYAAKSDGRRNWRAFEKSMDAKIQIRRLIELDLRAAVANESIDVYYQPIVHVATRQISSFEALARWNHPVRGRMSPAEFIPIVEELGLMDDLGASVLRRACLACASWPENICVSVNLSSTQFRSGKIEQTVLDALAAAQLSPERLELEITESTLLDDRGSTRNALEALRMRGVRISLDDFGTGYSSLSYMLTFPLDRIKIDRSFTIGLGVHERASILVESVARMSKQLGMSVLVEGVETEAQMRFIESLGTISEVQGFLFSPAVQEAEARKMLASGKQQRQVAAA